MSLATKVKAGSVSSLSDARFFAGMGVDWIGFDVNPASDSFVNADLYKSFVGWIAGPKRVIELPSGFDPSALPGLINDYQPEFLEADWSDLDSMDASLPVMVRISPTAAKVIDQVITRASYAVLNLGPDLLAHQDLIRAVAEKTKVLLHVSPDFKDLKKLMAELPLSGIALHGSKETQTGLKVYDYSDLLESIESEE